MDKTPNISPSYLDIVHILDEFSGKVKIFSFKSTHAVWHFLFLGLLTDGGMSFAEPRSDFSKAVFPRLDSDIKALSVAGLREADSGWPPDFSYRTEIRVGVIGVTMRLDATGNCRDFGAESIVEFIAW